MNIENDKTTIYIGNLPQNVTPQDLYAFFNTFGEIKSVQIPRDHLTQRQRGFAFIQFDEREDASSAIDNYDKTEFLGRVIKVRKAKALDQKPDYHKAVWANDEWLQNAENRKIEIQEMTRQQQDKNRTLGLPIWKQVKPKQEQKPLIYVQND